MLYARAHSSGIKRVQGLIVGLMIAASMVIGPVASSMEAEMLHDEGANSNYNYRSAELCFMRKVNQTRQRHGLRALQWDKQMGYVARRHAQQMASNRAVYHDGNVGNEVTRWRQLAQNTGRGRSCRHTFRSFMASAPHRAHVLGSYRFIGVGIEYRGPYVYVQQLFELRRNPGNVYHWP